MLATWSARAAIETSNPGTPWPATDALGRKLPTPAEVGPPQPDRFVGIFYFQWLVPEMPIPKSPQWDGPYDVGKNSGARSRRAEESRTRRCGAGSANTISGASRCTATTAAPIRG